MGVRAVRIASREESVRRLMETEVSGRKMAKIKKKQRAVKFLKEEQVGVSFYSNTMGEGEKEGVNIETG